MLAGFGPPVEVHVVTPVTPVIAQVPLADGARPFIGPVTVAVNEIVLPSNGVDPAETLTFGAALFTVVVNPEVGAVEA